MAGFGEGDGVIHGLAVTDLADQNHIRRLAQGIFQRREPAVGIYADFALGDDAFFVLMHVLDRIFDGDDVILRVLVAKADHGRERSGFAGAGATDENHQAALGHGHVAQHFRQVQFFKRGNSGIDLAQHDAHPRLLDESVDAKTPDIRRGDGEVAFLGRLELVGLFVVHDGARQFHRMLRGERLVGDGRDTAIDFQRRRKAGGDE